MKPEELKLKDFLASINHDKKPLLDKDEGDVRLYKPFVVNRCLSYFPDTIFHANEMNCTPWLDNKSQFDFYRLGIRKKKRFSPWLKKEAEEFRKNPYAGLSGVRLRKSRRSRQSRRARQSRRSRNAANL